MTKSLHDFIHKLYAGSLKKWPDGSGNDDHGRFTSPKNTARARDAKASAKDHRVEAANHTALARSAPNRDDQDFHHEASAANASIAAHYEAAGTAYGQAAASSHDAAKSNSLAQQGDAHLNAAREAGGRY